MADLPDTPPSGKTWTIFDLWAKYEDITMHFNDLLMRLRTQALAGVAALSTLVGIFTKTDPSSVHISWEIASAVFVGLSIFWVAIWIVDFWYYNPLLVGAVAALLKLEELSTNPPATIKIDLSTLIEESVKTGFPNTFTWRQRIRLRFGVIAFYFLVFVALLGGLGFSVYKELGTWSAPIEALCCV